MRLYKLLLQSPYKSLLDRSGKAVPCGPILLQIDPEQQKAMLEAFADEPEGLKAFHRKFISDCEEDLKALNELVQQYGPESSAAEGDSTSMFDEESKKEGSSGSIASSKKNSDQYQATFLTKLNCGIDWHAVEKYSHRLKGRASQLGFASLATCACKLVVLARATHIGCQDSCWETLAESFEATTREFAGAKLFIKMVLRSNCKKTTLTNEEGEQGVKQSSGGEKESSQSYLLFNLSQLNSETPIREDQEEVCAAQEAKDSE